MFSKVAVHWGLRTTIALCRITHSNLVFPLLLTILNSFSCTAQAITAFAERAQHRDLRSFSRDADILKDTADVFQTVLLSDSLVAFMMQP